MKAKTWEQLMIPYYIFVDAQGARRLFLAHSYSLLLLGFWDFGETVAAHELHDDPHAAVKVVSLVALDEIRVSGAARHADFHLRTRFHLVKCNLDTILLGRKE